MCGFIHFANHKVGGGIGRGMVAESARATGMCGRMCSSEGLGKAAGLSVAVRFWGWMGSFGELEDEEWYGRTVDKGSGGRGGEARRSAWFGSIGDARNVERGGGKGRWKNGARGWSLDCCRPALCEVGRDRQLRILRAQSSLRRPSPTQTNREGNKHGPGWADNLRSGLHSVLVWGRTPLGKVLWCSGHFQWFPDIAPCRRVQTMPTDMVGRSGILLELVWNYFGICSELFADFFELFLIFWNF